MTSLRQNAEFPSCERCGAAPAHSYQRIEFDAWPEPLRERSWRLCAACARAARAALPAETGPGLTRAELIATLDRFFAASGVFEICGRCHAQGTGCCPPTCRVMGAAGCDPDNRRGKTVFCATFLCAALLNAISECDPELGRRLRWIKRELGAAEFHIYEMITRVPVAHRDPVRPLALPARYPAPGELPGERIREQLLGLADEILEIRRLWSRET
ncbi:MAG: hypothetical protein SF339_09215 [Blastocatellia bacterium]|nr:hypothetical protein [Blastocatellia bacterium]